MHRVELRPMMGDVDAMNVVYYANYMRFFEKGRAELMRSTGQPYCRMAAEGLHLPVTEAGVRYRRPAFYDDLLVVETALAWMKKASLRFDYRILRPGSSGEEELLVAGFTNHCCVSITGRVAPLPGWVRQALTPHLTG